MLDLNSGSPVLVRHDGLFLASRRWENRVRCVTTDDRASRRTEQQTESQRTNFPSVMTEGYVRRDGRPLEIGFGILLDGLI